MTMGRFTTPKELYRSWRHRCAIPRSLLIDPTSCCNLKCTGCWAADYNKGDNLSLEKLDDIMLQAKRLGITDIVLSGGEPLLRKDDILALCKKHRRMVFGAFTNATLVDEKLTHEMDRLGNLTLFISIEGTRQETDQRRGTGSYDKAVQAMELLKQKNIGFAFSACYHANNYKTIASDEFLDNMRQRGAWFGWLFNYVPVGSGADAALVCSAEQRAHVHRRISEYCRKNDFLIIDFWNNGHLAFGCAAAGNGFAHINARGDIEPCAFCHYSDSNIHQVSLLEALRAPFFTAFRDSQPFSDNPLRSCPLVDTPERLAEIVKAGGAHSTHLAHPETPEQLTAKTLQTAAKWKATADELFKEMPELNRKNFPKFLKFHAFKKKHTDGRRKKAEKKSKEAKACMTQNV